MKLFGDRVSVIRGSIAWQKPFGLRIEPATPLAPVPLEAAPKPEYDEEGRLYVFRFARSVPQQRYSVERDRIFEYMKRRRLPSAGQRQIRRDVKNAVDFIADIREIQTPHDVEGA